MQKKGLLIDFGGTIDTDGVHWLRVFQAAYRECGLELHGEQLKEAYVYAERTLGRAALIESNFTFSRTLETKISLQLDFLKIDADRAAKHAGILLEYCMNLVTRNVELVSRPVLEQLSDSVPMVLVTNFYGNMHSVLRELDLERYFKSVVESATAGLRKPDSRIFSLGCDALGTAPGQTLMVGDSLDKDMAPAAAAGCRTCWLDRGMSFDAGCLPQFEPDMKISTLMELDITAFS